MSKHLQFKHCISQTPFSAVHCHTSQRHWLRRDGLWKWGQDGLKQQRRWIKAGQGFAAQGLAAMMTEDTCPLRRYIWMKVDFIAGPSCWWVLVLWPASKHSCRKPQERGIRQSIYISMGKTIVIYSHICCFCDTSESTETQSEAHCYACYCSENEEAVWLPSL